MGILVKNIENTGDKDCCCESWLAHWEKYSGKTAGECCAVNCSKPAEVGGHVKKVGVGDNKPYIIPICYSHNALGEDYEVEDSTDFVTAYL